MDISIVETKQLPIKNYKLSIIELTVPNIVQNYEDRFQIILTIDNKNYLPKDKLIFTKFEDDDKRYQIKSKLNYMTMSVPKQLFMEKKICDRTYKECQSIIIEIMSIKNESDIISELKKYFNF